MNITFDIDGSPEIHLDVLRAIYNISGKESMIDIGCGFAPQTRQLDFPIKRYIDIVERDLGSENPYFIQADILRLISTDNHTGRKWDALFCLDCIEHFKKSDSLLLLDWFTKISKVQAIFTPLGDYIIEQVETTNPDSHKSGWLPSEFEEKEYAVIVFTNFHRTLNTGAFFAFKSEQTEEDFNKIKTQLNTLSWTK